MVASAWLTTKLSLQSSKILCPGSFPFTSKSLGLGFFCYENIAELAVSYCGTCFFRRLPFRGVLSFSALLQLASHDRHIFVQQKLLLGFQSRPCQHHLMFQRSPKSTTFNAKKLKRQLVPPLWPASSGWPTRHPPVHSVLHPRPKKKHGRTDRRLTAF